MIITDKNIYQEALYGNVDVLEHPLASTLIFRKKGSNDGNRPLTSDMYKPPYFNIPVEALNHPLADKVLDKYGWTVLHSLACFGVIQILDHPSVDKVKCREMQFTPLHCYSGNSYYIPVTWINKKYPWYNTEGIEVIENDIILDILNRSNAEKFVLDL